MYLWFYSRYYRYHADVYACVFSYMYSVSMQVVICTDQLHHFFHLCFISGSVWSRSCSKSSEDTSATVASYKEVGVILTLRQQPPTTTTITCVMCVLCCACVNYIS